MRSIEAVFSEGAFHPLKRVDLEPCTRVRLKITEIRAPAIKDSECLEPPSDLEYIIIGAVENDPMRMDLDRLLEAVDDPIRQMSACENTEPLSAAQVEQVVRPLEDSGYLEVVCLEEAAVYRLGARGKVAASARRHHGEWIARKGESERGIRMPEKKGQRLEGLDIFYLDLPIRIRNSLGYQGVRAVGDLLRLTVGDVLWMRNIGPKSLKLIERELWTLGLRLRHSSWPDGR